MCAIFGIVGETNKTLLKKMSSCQIYRGPDSQSFLINKQDSFSIGMNRLSVIDRKKVSNQCFHITKDSLEYSMVQYTISLK